MADFNQAYNITMRNEAGYYAGAGDTGGETYKGISRAYQGSWEGWAIIDAYKHRYGRIKDGTTINDYRLETAVKKFFKINFWDALISGDRLTNQAVANFLFDFCVHKQYAAVQQIQKAIQAVFPKINYSSVKLTSDTVALLNKNAAMLYPIIYQQRINYYLAYGGTFVNAWIARVKRFPSRLQENILRWLFQQFY